MARRPISMNKQAEILHLKSLGLKERAIARTVKASRKTVRKYLHKVKTPPALEASIHFSWDEIIKEHQIGDVPLLILWEELKESGKTTWSYSYFWKQFQKHCPTSKEATMVRHHPSGERAEIDYCDGIDILDLATGEITRTHLFVGVMCRSRYTYAEFSFSQKSADFLNSHVRMFNFFGGVPRQIAPDNLKSAVSKAHKYDPDINPAYQRLAHHFKIAVVPARVRTPKDKAIVERSIQIFQRWFYKKVRKRTFTSLIELNKTLHEHLVEFNNKKHRILHCSRSEAFTEEKKDLGALPESEFTVRTHKRCTLHHDCHLQFEKNFYSAPWELREKELDVWASEKVVEIFHEAKLVAQHSRSNCQSKFATRKEHYPPAHRAYLEITPQYLLEKAQGSGENVYRLINSLFSEAYPLQHLRRAQGIVALINKYPKEQLDHACEQALLLGKPYIRFIEAMAKMSPYKSLEIPIREENPFLRQQDLLNTGEEAWTLPTTNYTN
jgi:transposase